MVNRPATARPARIVLRDSSRLATPGWWRIAIASLGWTSVTIAIAFWVGEGGTDDLMTGFASATTSVGQLAGMVSADLLMLQVLMMARVPVLERTYGQDGLLHIHRRLGFSSFNLLLLHITLVTVGYAGTGQVGLIPQFVDFVSTYSGILLATASTVLLTLVVVSSIRLARKRQRYETWHLIHLYAYLGVGLSIPHELAVGGAFTENMFATIYWWGIYLAAAAAVLIWRVALPLYRLLHHGLVVEKVVQEGRGVVSVHMRGRGLDRLNAGAGQFFLWRFLSGRGWTRAHPYSLSAAPSQNRLRITVKDLGDDSRRLAQLRPGTRVLAEGPFGRLHAGVRTQQRVALFAAGIGITPMRALLEELEYDPGELTLIYRATDEREIVLAEEIDELAELKGARVHYLIGPRRRSRRGGSWLPQAAGTISDIEGLRRLVPDIAGHDVYLCGPDPWLDSVVHTLSRAGVPPEQIHLERFSW